MIKFIIAKWGVNQNQIFKPEIPIDKNDFVELVDHSTWLTWHELTTWGKEFHDKNPNFAKKECAYFNLDSGVCVDIHYLEGYCMVTFEQKISYRYFLLIWGFAEKLDCLIWDRYSSKLITEEYLEALRIKEENRGIKLTKEQSHVLESIEDQCRWWYLPTEDLTKIFNILGIQPNIKDGDITIIIDDVQRENKVTIATFTGHTIIFGFNAPYISYPDLQTYITKEEQQTPHLQDVLNKLSKAFGTAAYFEYNNDDELIASLAWSSKGKFVYGRFTSEGEGFDVFGKQKKAMEVNQKSIIKTAKKLGMTTEDILTGMMKQKMPVQYFEQPHWYIQSRLHP